MSKLFDFALGVLAVCNYLILFSTLHIAIRQPYSFDTFLTGLIVWFCIYNVVFWITFFRYLLARLFEWLEWA